MAFERSTALASAEYHEDAATLTIRFRSGATHCFFMVPRRVFEGLVEAESAGRYFAAEIRPRYRQVRV
jgi:KTSC domain